MRLSHSARGSRAARAGAKGSCRCALCDSSQGLQVHHAIPRGEGGTDSPQNLITLCSYCHSHAHGRPLYDTPITAQEIAQACVEYLADYYAPDWNPWEKGRWSDG